MELEKAFRKRARASGGCSAGGPDWLSALPDCLLHVIMSFMKARQVVQTCVLSKRWRHLLRSVPCLDVDHDEFKKTARASEDGSYSSGDHSSDSNDDQWRHHWRRPWLGVGLGVDRNVFNTVIASDDNSDSHGDDNSDSDDDTPDSDSDSDGDCSGSNLGSSDANVDDDNHRTRRRTRTGRILRISLQT